MEQKFIDVFGKLNLGDVLEPALRRAVVESVSYFSSLKGLEVRLLVCEGTTPRGIVAAEEALAAFFSELDSVSIIPIYKPQPEPMPTTTSPQNDAPKRKNGSNGNGNGNGYVRQAAKALTKIEGEPKPLKSDFFEGDEVIVVGRIFKSEAREARKGAMFIYTIEITDDESSITLKYFLGKESLSYVEHLLKVGTVIKIAGKVENDKYSSETTITIHKIAPGELNAGVVRMDNAETKRVELHLHTNMSVLDGMTPAKEIVARAASWGHKAVAITDHGVVQAYPEAMEAAAKHGIKLIYGMEAYLVDDLDVSIASRPKNAKLSDDFVVFDIETTGLNREHCTIIEIGAVRMRDGEVGEIFHAFVDPEQDLPAEIIKLTNITDDMLVGKPKIAEVLPQFLEFVGDSILVAHNADFDMGFVEHIGRQLGYFVDNPYLCTLQLSRALFPNLTRHGLAAMAKHHEIAQESHHRASDDANVLAQIFSQQIEILKSRNIDTLHMINLRYAKEIDVKTLRPRHATILVKSQEGMRNLYELVSKSHLEHFNRYPRIPKSEFIALREGLLIGTACEQGALYIAVKENRPQEDIEKIAQFYDYFEVQPIGNNAHLVRQGEVESEQSLRDINIKIVEYAETYNKPVIAAGDVHFMDPDDGFYRSIIQTGQGFKDADEQAPLYFRTTEEMLDEFAYFGDEKAYELVVTNTNALADSIDEGIRAIPKGTFPPIIEGSEKELQDMVWAKARNIYGDDPPQIVQDRINKELGSIIKNNFSVMYIIAQKLIARSMEDGYLVGSRGSIGSSLVATFSDITEVNPLAPHYYCKECKYSDFDSDVVKQYAGAHGCDMPDANCPKCGEQLTKEGHSIPFETFLGFEGDKEPDIDLNFSGEYQATAHAYAEEILGKGYVFKAGTISTVANKTAFGYVKKYLEQKGRVERNAHVNRLAAGCEGIKRTTGQHPGGLMVVPKGRSIYEFTPIQRPANDQKTDVITTHFDYHSIHENLLKLDLLGHDVPTILKLLHDFTGVNPLSIDLGDKDALSLFRSPEKLGITERETGLKTGSLGLPEFGTDFVRGMLAQTNPTSFADLVRISGLSHGTNVWLNNGQELMKSHNLTLKEIISTRDDIMLYLISKGLTEKDAFNITEKVRKGRGVNDEEEALMLANRVPKWYVDSCRKIAYMFPKGHAVAYVMQAVRFAWYKIHHPMAFYAAAFSVKSDEFSHETMCKGRDVAKMEMQRIAAAGKDATQKELKSVGLLELVVEMYHRGLGFAPLDIYAASADKFIITEKGLLPPLCAVAGLGSAVAERIVETRKDGEFFSIDDLKTRTGINKTVVQLLKDNGVLDGMPETEQLTLF